MFEVKLNEDYVRVFDNPGLAVVAVTEHLGLEPIHMAPLFNAIASLGSGRSFIDHDSGVIVTALH